MYVVLVKGKQIKGSLCLNGACTLSSMFCQLVPIYPSELLLPSKRMHFSGFMWPRVGQESFFYEFVGQVMVKGDKKGPEERCWSGDGQERSKKCVLVK